MHGCWRWYSRPSLRLLICQMNFPPHRQISGHFLLAYRTLMGSVLTGLFYFFFAVFPTRSPIERKVPWLKWALLASGICLSLGGYRQGDSRALPFILAVVPDRIAQDARRVVVYGSVLLGLVSLLCNRLSASKDDLRKIKVIFWGTVAGVTPAAAIALAQEVLHAEIPFWVNFAKVILLFLFPLSFAYAVVKHRVMDIPVLLKRSARYFMVERGFVILILVLSVGLTLWFGQAFSHYFSAGSKAAIPDWCDVWRAGDLGRNPSPSPGSDATGPRLFPQLL